MGRVTRSKWPKALLVSVTLLWLTSMVLVVLSGTLDGGVGDQGGVGERVVRAEGIQAVRWHHGDGNHGDGAKTGEDVMDGLHVYTEGRATHWLHEEDGDVNNMGGHVLRQADIPELPHTNSTVNPQAQGGKDRVNTTHRDTGDTSDGEGLIAYSVMEHGPGYILAMSTHNNIHAPVILHRKTPYWD